MKYIIILIIIVGVLVYFDHTKAQKLSGEGQKPEPPAEPTPAQKVADIIDQAVVAIKQDPAKSPDIINKAAAEIKAVGVEHLPVLKTKDLSEVPSVMNDQPMYTPRPVNASPIQAVTPKAFKKLWINDRLEEMNKNNLRVI